MKRIHLFEFEDLPWFPDWLRTRMTRFIVTIHKILESRLDLARLLAGIIEGTGGREIVDFCSGSGGPLLDTIEILDRQYGIRDLKVTLTDLYPNEEAAKAINKNEEEGIQYELTPVDATDNNIHHKGIRTFIGSFHHMKPEAAKRILENAKTSHQPICIYEISDNSFPIFFWWMVIPVNVIMILFVTPFVRPMSWQQIVFTYLIPILPLLIAWDGAVSNARTYTLHDLEKLLEGLHSNDNYTWEKGVIKHKVRKLYLLGFPKR